MKSKFIEAMDQIQAEVKGGDISLQRLIDILGDESHPLVLLLLSLPYLFPISIPGLSTPVGVLVVAVAIMLFLNKPPWIPKKYRAQIISSENVNKVTETAEKIWSKLAHFIKQRWIFVCTKRFFKTMNLFVFLINGIFLSLPFPIPFSNTMPGIAIILCSLGHLEKDGFFIFLSYLWTVLVIGFFVAISIGFKFLI